MTPEQEPARATPRRLVRGEHLGWRTRRAGRRLLDSSGARHRRHALRVRGAERADRRSGDRIRPVAGARDGRRTPRKLAAERRRTERRPGEETEPLGPRELRVLTALAFASGGLVFAAEVVFTHLLALIIGNSAYAFGMILAVFLLCLAFGASRAAWVQAKFGDAALPLGLALAAIALALTIPLWERLPLLFTSTGEVLHDLRRARSACARSPPSACSRCRRR